MAYQTKQSNTEHASKTIVKMMQQGKQMGVWPRVILLCGKEDFLVDWAKNYLKENILNPVTEALDFASFEADADPYEVIATCETSPLMSDRKLIFTEDMESKELCDYIPKISDTTLLVFITQKPNKTRSTYKAIAKHGIVYDFTQLDDGTLSGWMAKRLKAAGKSARPSDLIEFARSCGYGDAERSYTLFNLENDIKKAVSVSENAVLTLDDFMRCASAQAEVNAFKLLDSAFSDRKSDALNILHNSIDIQTPSKEIGTILSFLGLICSQLEIMLEAKERQKDGQGIYDIVAQMGVNEYRLKKALQSASNRDVASLRKSLDNAFQIEKDLKNGVMDPYLAMELFIAKL